MKTVITIEHKTANALKHVINDVVQDINRGFLSSSGEVPLPRPAEAPSPMPYPPGPVAQPPTHTGCDGCRDLAEGVPETEYSYYEFKTED